MSLDQVGSCQSTLGSGVTIMAEGHQDWTDRRLANVVAATSVGVADATLDKQGLEGSRRSAGSPPTPLASAATRRLMMAPCVGQDDSGEALAPGAHGENGPREWLACVQGEHGEWGHTHRSKLLHLPPQAAVLLHKRADAAFQDAEKEDSIELEEDDEEDDW